LIIVPVLIFAIYALKVILLSVFSGIALPLAVIIILYLFWKFA